MSGTIERVGYIRKAHARKAYTRTDGTHVVAAHVKQTYVPPSQIPDRGAPGKGPKLIDMKDDRHLSASGYSLSGSAHDRHLALEKVAQKHGYPFTVRRVNAIATLLKNTKPAASGKARSDVRYLQKVRRELGAKTPGRKLKK